MGEIIPAGGWGLPQIGGTAPTGGVGGTTTGGGAGGGVGGTTTGGGGVGQTTTGTGLDGPNITFGMASRRQTGPLDVGLPDGMDIHLLGFDADNHAINSLHLSTNTLWIGDAIGGDCEGLLSEPGGCPGGDAPLEFNCWREPEEGIYPVPVRLGFDEDSQHSWCGGPKPGLWRWWSMCNYYVANSQSRQGTRAGSPCDIQGNPGPSVQPSQPSSVTEPFVATVVQTASPVILGRPNLISPTFADLRSHLSPDAQTLLAQDLYTPITYRMEAYGAQGGACSGSVLGDNAGYAGAWIEGEPWNYTEQPGDGRFEGGTASGGVVLMPPEVDMADIDEGLAPNGRTLSTTFMIAAPNARFGAGLPNLADGAMDDGYSWFVDNGKLVFNRHIGDCPGLGVRSLEMDTSGDMILGQGEGGIVAATGKTFRAPDVSSGSNIAGADLTFAAGLGRGIGDAAIIDFHLPIVGASGDNPQTRASRLTLDMDSNSAVGPLRMTSAQALNIITSTGDLLFEAFTDGTKISVNERFGDVDFTVHDSSGVQIAVDAALRTTTIAGNTFIPKTATVGAIVVASTTLTAATNDAVDVTDISHVLIDTSSNSVAFGGTVNAVTGQILHVAISDATNNTTMEDSEGTTQDFQLHAGGDETLVAKFGGWSFIFNGTVWLDLSHAKHV